MYKDQMAAVKIVGFKKEAFIKKEVRQGCLLSQLIFNSFIDYVLQHVNEMCGTGIKIQG